MSVSTRKKHKPKEFHTIKGLYEASWSLSPENRPINFEEIMKIILHAGGYIVVKPRELRKYSGIAKAFYKKDVLPQVSSDATERRIRFIQEQIKDFALKFAEVIEVYLHHEDRLIQGAIFIKKFNHVDSKIYKYIAKTKLNNPYFDFQIVIIRKKDIVDSQKYIRELSKIAEIRWKK